MENNIEDTTNITNITNTINNVEDTTLSINTDEISSTINNVEDTTTTITNIAENTNTIIIDEDKKQKKTKEPKEPKESKEPKEPKVIKEQFNQECNHCSKIFKSKQLYDKHTIQQLCYTKDEITYCKICCETSASRNDYKKHLFSMNHLSNIGYNNIERLQNKEVPLVNLVDPYLNKSDVNKITNTNLGDSFTFVFSKGNTKTVSLVNNINLNIKDSTQQENKDQEEVQDQKEVQEKVQEVQDKEEEQIKIEYTEKQLKLILYLENQTQQCTANDSGKKLYKMLDNNLQIEDYKGLQTIINNLNILDNYKNMYIKVVELFINMLVKQKNKGEKLYKNKDISQLVINLSS